MKFAQLLIPVLLLCSGALFGQGKTTDIKDEQIAKEKLEVRSGGILKVAGYEVSGISNDPLLDDSLNSHLVTEAAVKGYIDNNAGSNNLTFTLVGTTLTITDGVGSLTASFTGWDTNASDDLTTGTTFAGDVGGAWNNLQLGAGSVTGTELATGAVVLSGTDVTGTLGAGNGGTGLPTFAAGSLLYGSAANTWSALAPSTNGFVLTLVGGTPAWQVAPTGLPSGTNGQTLRHNGTSWVASSGFYNTNAAFAMQHYTKTTSDDPPSYYRDNSISGFTGQLGPHGNWVSGITIRSQGFTDFQLVGGTSNVYGAYEERLWARWALDASKTAWATPVEIWHSGIAIKNVDGSVASPSYTFANAVSTGMTKVSSKLVFSNGGIERIGIGSNGEVYFNGSAGSSGGALFSTGASSPPAWTPISLSYTAATRVLSLFGQTTTFPIYSSSLAGLMPATNSIFTATSWNLGAMDGALPYPYNYGSMGWASGGGGYIMPIYNKVGAGAKVLQAFFSDASAGFYSVTQLSVVTVTGGAFDGSYPTIGAPIRLSTTDSYFNGSGNVSIGATSGTEKLTLVGNFLFSGALMPNNLPGTSGQFLTSGGAGNPNVWVTGSLLPVGTNGQTLRHNGTSWVASSAITNTGTDVGILATSQWSAFVGANGIYGNAGEITSVSPLFNLTNALGLGQDAAQFRHYEDADNAGTQHYIATQVVGTLAANYVQTLTPASGEVGVWIKTAATTIDFPSTGASSFAESSITLSGAVVGKPCFVGYSISVQGEFSCRCEVAGTLIIRYNNTSLVTIDPTSSSFELHQKL